MCGSRGSSPARAGGGGSASCPGTRPCPRSSRGRRIDMISATESKNEMWLAAMMAGPRVGTCSSPSIRIGHSSRYNGPAATRPPAVRASHPAREAARLGLRGGRGRDARQARGFVLERDLQPGAVDEATVGPDVHVEADHLRGAGPAGRAARLDDGAGRPLPRLVAGADQLDEGVDAHGATLTQRAPGPALLLPRRPGGSIGAFVLERDLDLGPVGHDLAALELQVELGRPRRCAGRAGTATPGRSRRRPPSPRTRCSCPPAR